MNFDSLKEDVKIPSKQFLSNILLYSSSFSCFFFFFARYDDIFPSLGGKTSFTYIVSQVVFLSLVVSFAIIGSIVGERYNRKKLLFALIAFGTVAAILPMIFQGVFVSLFFSALVGVSFGLSFPVVNAYLSDCTVVEERGRIFGTSILVTFILVIVANIFASTLFDVLLFSVILRAAGFFALTLDPCKRTMTASKSWRSIFSYRNFMFYMFPWLMFNIANGLYSFVNFPQTDEYLWASTFGNVVHVVGAGLFAFIAGIIADKIGRKQPIMVGLVLLGISYVLLGFAPSWQTLFAYLTLSGVAWGLIMAVYFVIPGDLAFAGSQERFYALGAVIPFILYSSFSSFAKLIPNRPETNTLSPILSIVLFLSVIPLFFVPETLPESKTHERKLKKHIEKIGELIQDSKKS